MRIAMAAGGSRRPALPTACRRGGRDRPPRSRPRGAGHRHDVDQDAQRRRQGDAAAEQDAEVAAKQAGAIESEDRPMPGSRDDRADQRGTNARRCRNSHQAERNRRRPRTAPPSALSRRKSETSRKRVERRVGLGAEIAQHDRELRQHEQKKEQHHTARGDQHEGRILHRIGELAPHRLPLARARRPAAPARDRGSRRLHRPGPARHTSPETAWDDRRAPRQSSRRRKCRIAALPTTGRSRPMSASLARSSSESRNLRPPSSAAPDRA